MENRTEGEGERVDEDGWERRTYKERGRQGGGHRHCVGARCREGSQIRTKREGKG